MNINRTSISHRILKVSLNGLVLALCLLGSPIVFSVLSSPAEAAPRTTGRPKGTESAGRRAALPPQILGVGSQLT